MGDPLPNQSQTRAHKKNIGAVQALGKSVEQMRKDKKKSLQTIDQEVLDAHKFLEQVKTHTGYSVSFQDVFPAYEKQGVKNNLDIGAEKYRPTKSSLMRSEVKLRKAISEANFRMRSAEFFRKWDDVFQIDLALDDWFAKQQLEEENDVSDDDGGLWVIPVGSPAKM
uniref:Uncharacterized LOC100183560 n=1 Tax=Ciona intestinalis TaxID=7719 RepID=F6QRA5_CIOIN|nr:uncharacterized protein LOC100183560 [Ciona intestinalis]|eukprot:XP_026694181.1 uncharacterized protein LOC100183560 [Ciona intestinalis]